ncbi:MAG: type I 3-dehydroquinate dehydratase [Planctomycetes bacterium]|nr:type I 3-dehydroquinate dehydratase [Planctomycetota bacterium]
MAVVVSHLAKSFDSLARQALRQAPLADVVELRLERCGNPGLEPLAQFVRALGKPVIVAVHGAEGFGDFRGDVDERCDILRTAARAGAMFVDIDASHSLALGALEGTKCHRIVSRHAHDGTPEDLAAFEDSVRAVMYEGDLIKLVAHARSTEDGLRMLRHLRGARGGLIAFCSGERGSFTRVLCRIFGSAFTYAAPARIPGEPEPEASAPGQLRVNDLRSLFPPGGISPETAIFGVVGERVRHSLSPRVHDMALKSARLDAVFLAFETDDWQRFLALADDVQFRGFAVTAPFKEAAARSATAGDELVRATLAANTLVRDARGWRAFNTDVHGVRETLERAYKFHREKSGAAQLATGAPLGSAHALILGAGGAARAVVQAVKLGGGRATLAARDERKAQSVARELGARAVAWDAIASTAHDILVHATPVGSLGDEQRSPIPDEWLRPGSLVLDAVYRPLKTKLLTAALARGCTAVPGAEWFVRQAQAQFRLFTQHNADEQMMRAALEHALGGGR